MFEMIQQQQQQQQQLYLATFLSSRVSVALSGNNARHLELTAELLPSAMLT